MDFNRYFTNEELESTLKAWEAEYGGILALETIGESGEGRPIWLMTITNKETGPHSEKPAVWVDANIHASELAGCTTAMRIAWALLSGYGEDAAVTRRIDEGTFYIVPRVSPDGAALALQTPPKIVRSSPRPYPWEEKAEGLHIEDVDGDGRILQMRIEDPNGDWKISTLNPRLMEKRAPDETEGTFYRLLPEGTLEDFDGYTVNLARRREGMDFNRNFPVDWRPEAEQTGAGPYPGSEPETYALMEAFTARPNISAAVAFHTYSGVILRPYSVKADDEMITEDLWTYQAIGERGTELTGYRCISIFHDFKYHPKEVVSGAFDEWAYDHLGAFAFTIELWDIVNRAGIDEEYYPGEKKRSFIDWFRDHPHEQDVKILQWAEENVEGAEPYVDWYTFKHPQLGKIELGGWDNLYTWRNPPHNWMGAEAERNVPFIMALADMLPRITLHTLDVTPLENGAYHLNLVVENAGYFPTFTSEQGKKRRATRPVRAEVQLPEGAEIVAGRRRVELGHLEGRSNKRDAFGAYSPTDNRARAEWVVRAPAGSEIQIDVLSERGGALHETVTLG